MTNAPLVIRLMSKGKKKTMKRWTKSKLYAGKELKCGAIECLVWENNNVFKYTVIDTKDRKITTAWNMIASGDEVNEKAAKAMCELVLARNEG